ncbi:DHS-like NAD/FAD-binding domain-containing protein, partial [Pluteus cervinus]
MVYTLDLQMVSQSPHDLSALRKLFSVDTSKKIVVVSGAGISRSSGIPDFRSADGIFNSFQKRFPRLFRTGRDAFDATVFDNHSTAVAFYAMMVELKHLVDAALPTPTHTFIKKLEDQKRLLRYYTQNIDGLEQKTGLSGGKAGVSGKSVQLHGDIHTLRCAKCSFKCPFTKEHELLMLEGITPECSDCESRAAGRHAKGERELSVGKLRHDIVLYSEQSPHDSDIARTASNDMIGRPDLLLIMGTSMDVYGVKILIQDFAKAVHMSFPKADGCGGRVIYVNRTPPSHDWDSIIDYHLMGDTDVWVKLLQDD